MNVLVLHQVAGKLKTGPDILLGEVGKVVHDDVPKILSGGDQIQDLRNLNPLPRIQGLPWLTSG